ncbi:E3 ubiquitin-protein ligase DCST1-like isoform X1 [Poeciliopsis prolifica]|uniref:E3 ubiquitin-protein ligase DCST1-like isoform X1 n=1 Tax=Poeciliopsis prolifica TaxID=188132 RepID=UPI0024144E4C|nr:E3 ubiquitin-protein ligase DCST1-like isoform X1 [Poeciliopsis prolifica]
MCGVPPPGCRSVRLPEGSWTARAASGLFGAAGGAVLYLGFSHNLPLTFDLKLAVGIAFVGVCIIGGILSSSFRCTILLTLPSILGSRGRSYLMVMIVMILYKGPISNMERNAEAAALSLSCNLDLQVQHSRVLWRLATKPFLMVAKQLMKDKVEFESDSLDISKKFQNIRDEVLQQYGYNPIQQKPGGAAQRNSTQEQFAFNTRRRCDGMVNEGIRRCAGWFKQKWNKCMKAIPVPIINHILCISMKFDFLCDILRIMTPWCREQIPVERNFGQLYDRLNLSMDHLSREFRTQIVVQEEQQQSVLDGVQLDLVFTEAVKESFQRLTERMDQGMKVLEMVLSFTFITVFIQAVQYLRSYRTNISFDNVYITSYFRRIDERRRRAGKHFLLPLRKSERKRFIAPMSPNINPQEFTQVATGAFQVLTISLLVILLLGIDFSLFQVLNIINSHTFTQFNITSSHHIDISVGGDTMMARMLRTTISGFNSSSKSSNQSDNRACLFAPTRLPFEVYVRCVGVILVVALFSCVQVYTNRLRHVIAAFYNPKREKKRLVPLQPAAPQTAVVPQMQDAREPRTEDDVSAPDQVGAPSPSLPPAGCLRPGGDSLR